MLSTTKINIAPNHATRYLLSQDGEKLNYAQFLRGLAERDNFRTQFNRILADSEFSAFRWETPALSNSTADRPFEFVLLNAPSFSSRRTDQKTYREYFRLDDQNQGVVAFPNLSGDATLVVPCPQTEVDAYGHLAAFVRNAPESQVDNFWRVVGETAQSTLEDRPVWLNTAGGGVAWLHVRLDSRPKYYGHAPYK